LGIPAVSITADHSKAIQHLAQANANLICTVDLQSSMVSGGDASFELHMPEHHKQTLQQGLWDSTTLLLDNLDKIKSLYNKLPYTNHYNT